MQRATVQFIEDAAADDNDDFRYVLVPFNDPGEHFRVRELAKGELSHSLKILRPPLLALGYEVHGVDIKGGFSILGVLHNHIRICTEKRNPFTLVKLLKE